MRPYVFEYIQVNIDQKSSNTHSCLQQKQQIEPHKEDVALVFQFF